MTETPFESLMRAHNVAVHHARVAERAKPHTDAHKRAIAKWDDAERYYAKALAALVGEIDRLKAMEDLEW